MRARRCPTCGRAEKRSTQANARYWALLHEIAERIRPQRRAYSAECWHEFFKQRFLGCDEVLLPTREALQLPRSTADLDVAAFGDYQLRVEAWASERGVYLSDET